MQGTTVGTQDLSGQAARGTAWLGLVNILSKGSQIVVTLALGAFLTRDQLGTVTIAVAVLNIAQMIQLLGIYDVLSRTKHDPLAFAGSLATMTLVTGVVVAGMLAAFAGPLAQLLGAPQAPGPIRAIAFTLPFTAYVGIQFAYLHRQLDFKARLLPDAGSALVGAAVTVAAAAAGAGSWSLVAGVVVTAVLGPALALLGGVRIPLSYHREYVREAMAWVKVVGPAAMLGVLLLNIDYVVVTRVLGEAATGLYSYAYRFAFVPYIMVAVVLGGVAFPVYTRLMDDGGPAAVAPAFTRLLHAQLAVVVGLYLLLALLAPRIVVIDARWAPSAPVVSVLSLYGVLLCLVAAGHDATRAIGRPVAYLQAMAMHVGLLAVFAVVAVHAGSRPAVAALLGAGTAGDSHAGGVEPVVAAGIVGVAWAQVGAAALTGALVYVRLGRAGVLQRRAARSVVGPLSAAALTGAAFVAVARAGWLPADDSLPGLVVVGLVLSLAYGGVLLAVDRTAIGEILALLRRR